MSAAWVDVAKGIRLACAEVQQLRSAHAAGILAPISVSGGSEGGDISRAASQPIFLQRGTLPREGDKVTVEILALESDKTSAEEAKLYEILLGDGQAIPDLEAAIINLAEGETRDFHIRFPNDYVEAGRRGLTRLLRIKLIKLDKQK